MTSKEDNTTVLAHLLTWNYGYTREELYNFFDAYRDDLALGDHARLKKIIARDRLPKNTESRVKQAGAIEDLWNMMDASQVCSTWSISPLCIIHAHKQRGDFWWGTVDEAINLYYFIDLLSPQEWIDTLEERVEHRHRLQREEALALFRVHDDLRSEALHDHTDFGEDRPDPSDP